MKCNGCEEGLPLIVVAGQATHYRVGDNDPHSVCETQHAIADPIAAEVSAWEGEGGKAS